MGEKICQATRILEIIRIFKEETDDEHSLTLDQLNNHLLKSGISVERKTLYSDIHLINDYGIDIIMENVGRERHYYIGNRDFELPELKLLVDAVQSSKFITEKKSKHLINKLESLTSRYESRQLERQVYVSGRIKTENEAIYYNVDKLHTAINRNVMIHFQYFQWSLDKQKVLRHEGKIYKVSPWALTWDNENYYLVGYDEEFDDIRHYRVDKMLNIELTDTARSGQDNFDAFNIVTYTNKLFGMFDGDVKHVCLYVKNEFAGIIIDRFGTDIDVRKINDNWFEVTVEVAISDQFLGWIISLGENVVIKDPEDVVEKMKRIGERIGKVYG